MSSVYTVQGVNFTDAHGSMKYGLIGVLFFDFDRELRIADHCLTEMVIYGLVADQSLTAMARRSEFNSNCKPWIATVARDWLIRL